jgi:hypothetical protein
MAGRKQEYLANTGKQDFETRFLTPEARKAYLESQWGGPRSQQGGGCQQAEQTKTVDGKTYCFRNGKWYDQ